APGGEASDHLQPATADRIRPGGDGRADRHRFARVPAGLGVEYLADDLPAGTCRAQVEPEFRHPADRPVSVSAELDVAVRVYRVRREFARHREAVVDEVTGEIRAGDGLAEETPGGFGARPIERQRSGETSSAADARLSQADLSLGNDARK